MPAHTARITVETGGDNDMVDLTRHLVDAIAGSTVTDGIVTVFVPGSTAGITVTEFEPGLVDDTAQALDRLVPRDLVYGHNRGAETNGHAHVRASLIGPSLTVPFTNGSPTLGPWQQVVLIDFDDRPRRREVILQVVG